MDVRRGGRRGACEDIESRGEAEGSIDVVMKATTIPRIG
jgi:hypothetical protein